MTTTSVTGSGAFTFWGILALTSALAVASPPLAIANGVTGRSTGSLAQANFYIARTVGVIAALASEPGFPSVGIYLALPPANGASWSDHDWEWATWNGAAWLFESQSNGDRTIDATTGAVWSYSAEDSAARIIGGHTWDEVNEIRAPTTVTDSFWYIDGVVSSGRRASELLVYVVNGLADAFVTLPVAETLQGPAGRIIIRNKSGSNKKVNVSSAGTIDGYTEVSIPDNTTAEFGVYRPYSGGPPVVKEWTQLH